MKKLRVISKTILSIIKQKPECERSTFAPLAVILFKFLPHNASAYVVLSDSRCDLQKYERYHAEYSRWFCRNIPPHGPPAISVTAIVLSRICSSWPYNLLHITACVGGGSLPQVTDCQWFDELIGTDNPIGIFRFRNTMPMGLSLLTAKYTAN